MARTCLFTLNLNFAASLKQNFKYQVFKHAHIHKCALFGQHETAEKILENHNSSNNHKSHDPKLLKIKIMQAGLTFVPEYGWTEKSLAFGARSLGLSSAAHGLIQGGGPDLVHYFNFSSNLKLEEDLKKVSSVDKKTDLQTFLVDALENRLKMVIPYVSKWPEAMALMALPTQLPEHTRNALHLVDIIWHFYGDKSVDMSWYSKRLALAIAYKAAELSLIQDKSPDYIDTFDFVERRVLNVIEADSLIHTINTSGKHLVEFGEGGFITARNLLGLNRWRR